MSILFDDTMIRVRNLLQTKPQRPLVYFTEDQPLDDALQILAKNDIHCAPVYDSSTRNLKGVMDILDATRFVINLYYGDATGLSSPSSPRLDSSSWKTYATKLSCGLHTVGDILNSAVKQRYWDTVSPEDTFLNVLQLFAKGMHILLVAHQGQIVNVLSQLDVVRFIADEHIDLHEINFARHQTLKDLSFVQRDGDGTVQNRINCVNSTESVATAFYLMHKNGLTSICVSEHGKLVGNVSPIDLEGFLEEEFQHFDAPVLDYVKFARRRRDKQPGILITCTGEDTLLALLRRLANGNVHRAYIVNENYEPVGFVSVEDVFEKLGKVALERQRTSGADHVA